MELYLVYKWLINALNEAVDGSCHLCSTKLTNKNNILCDTCTHDFPFNHHACTRCGVALPLSIYKKPFMSPDKFRDSSISANNDAFEYICGGCSTTPPSWHKLIALCQYEYPVSRLIHKIKYSGKFPHARVLSRLLLDKIRTLALQSPDLIPDCIIPVPLHPGRQRQRGFNQAIELARPIAKGLGIILDHHSCKRTLDTASQSSLEHIDRLYNLNGAFHLKNKLPYKHIVIFDDVVTTGSTVSSLCKLLYQTGVERVDVWCIARASKNN